MAVTRHRYALEALEALDAPVTRRNLWALGAWMQAEGGSAKFNPMNTTQDMAGATDYNWVGVKNYRDLDDGVRAFVKTLNYTGHGYEGIKRGLRQNRWASKTLLALLRSDWGTGALALACLPFVKVDYHRYSRKHIGQ